MLVGRLPASAIVSNRRRDVALTGPGSQPNICRAALVSGDCEAMQAWRVNPSGRPERTARLPVTQGDTDHCQVCEYHWRTIVQSDAPCGVLARVAGTPTLVVGWLPRLDGLESDKNEGSAGEQVLVKPQATLRLDLLPHRSFMVI
jgi:hypothetical protein